MPSLPKHKLRMSSSLTKANMGGCHCYQEPCHTCRAVTLSLRKKQSQLTGAAACYSPNSIVELSIRQPTCQTRTPASCGTALTWSADLLKTRHTTCVAWSRILAYRLCQSHRTWPFKPPQLGSVCLLAIQSADEIYLSMHA